MSKKILQILRMITHNIQEGSGRPDEPMPASEYSGEDLFDIGQELDDLEFSDYLDEEELDILKALLVYLLLRDTSFEDEDIYSFVFGKGRKITWQ